MMRKLIIVLLSLLTVNHASFSQTKYSVERIILGSANKLGLTNTVRFEVKGVDRELKYFVDLPVDYDLPYPAGYVFEDGSLAVVWSYDASVELFSSNGSLIKKHFMLGENNIEYERSLMAAADGEILVLALSGPNLPYSRVQVINSEAELLNEWNSEYKTVTGIALDNSRKIIALSGYNFKDINFDFSSSFLNSDGISLGVISKVFRKGYFDSEGTFTAYDNNNTFKVSSNSFEILEEFKAAESEIVLDSYSDRGILIIAVAAKPELVKGEWLYTDLQIVEMKNSIIQRKRSVSHKPFRKAGLVASPDGMEINVDGSLISPE